MVVAPFLRDSGAEIGLTLSSESALAAGLVMGIMIIPFISSLSDDVINAVPQTLRDGAAALGATQSETIRQVVLLRRLAGHSQRDFVGHVAGHWRDHDCRHGGRRGGQFDRQSV